MLILRPETPCAKGPFFGRLYKTAHDDPNYKVAQDPWPLKLFPLWKENSGPGEYVHVPWEEDYTQTEGKHFNFMQFMALTLLPLIHHSQERIRVERAFKPHSACSFRSRDVKSFGNTFFLWQKSKEGTRTFFAQQAVKENDFDGCCYDLLSFF